MQYRGKFSDDLARKTFVNIAKKWQLNEEEQRALLGSADRLERISCLIGIYKALQILLPNPTAADKWIKKKNAAPLFGGDSALDRMMSGNVRDIYIVREYLEQSLNGGLTCALSHFCQVCPTNKPKTRMDTTLDNQCGS